MTVIYMTKKVYCKNCKWLGTKEYSSGTSYQACICPNIPYRDSWYHRWQPDNPMDINENNDCKCFEEK